MSKVLTNSEVEIMAHALGASSVKKGKPLGFRNYFCGAVDDPELQGLVASGHMSAGGKINEGRDQYFAVTELGIGALVKKGYTVKLS